MKIDWKARITNKTTLTAIVSTVVAFVYQMLGIFGVVTPVSPETAVQTLGIIINVLVAIGVVIDPTTAGMGDGEKEV